MKLWFTAAVCLLLGLASAVNPEGESAFDAIKDIEGIPKSLEDIQRLFSWLGFGAGLAREFVLERGGATIKIPKDCRIWISLEATNLKVRFEPAFTAKKRWKPTAYVRLIKFDFGESPGKWSADASTKRGYFKDTFSEAIADVMKNEVTKYLPRRLVRGGYNLKEDPNLLRTIANFKHELMPSANDVPTSSSNTNSDDLFSKLKRMLKDMSAQLVIVSGEAFKIPFDIPQGNKSMHMEAEIPRSTRFKLGAEAVGTLIAPRIKDITLYLGRQGITINNVGRKVFDTLKGLLVKKFVVLPGGQVKLEYDLQIEQIVNGISSLLRVGISTLSNQPITSRPPDVRFEMIREMIDEKLSASLTPYIREFANKYDTILPGFSLRQIMRTPSDGRSPQNSLRPNN